MRLSVPLALFAVALLVRILCLVYITGMESSRLERSPDSKDYDALGFSLASGAGFANNNIPRTYRPLGCPFSLAGVCTIFGCSYAAVVLDRLGKSRRTDEGG